MGINSTKEAGVSDLGLGRIIWGDDGYGRKGDERMMYVYGRSLVDICKVFGIVATHFAIINVHKAWHSSCEDSKPIHCWFERLHTPSHI